MWGIVAPSGPADIFSDKIMPHILFCKSKKLITPIAFKQFDS